jgi:glutathione S-transferase
MAVAKFCNAPVTLENVNWGAAQRDQLKNNSSTNTFPYLVTPDGNLSEAYAIIQYLASNFDGKLYGANKWENAQVNQWVQFAQIEITRYNKALIYPILGFYEYNAVEAQRASVDVVQWVKVLDAHLAGRNFVVGDQLTLADLELFYPLRFYMQLHFTEETRNLMPNVVAWFSRLMVMPNIVTSYGRTLFCKVAQTAAPQNPELVNKLNFLF